ncbi:AAA family ATPase [Microcoleus sp.]|uniref:AAA family ATPase n=1 Tax=Microcoleus sp. TaxID=44472 RepID=UPI00352595B8
MLNSVKIERFKNITEIEIPLGGINLLIGSNNAGKSSIQQAIQFAVSVAQSTNQQNARWKKERCPSSLSSQDLIYSPLRDIQALAPQGRLPRRLEYAIKITFVEENESADVTIINGKNKNIATSITGKILGTKLQNIESPFSIIVPGLAGVPAFEEYRPPSVVRKAAAKGDANSVFRNVLLLLSEDKEAWNIFIEKFKLVFPEYDISITFDNNRDEHINAKVIHNKSTLPIDACGTGILQAIQLLSYYYLYKPQLLILDEPDSHLHPNNQRLIALLLKQLHNETGCQMLISTHSRHFFEAIKESAEIHWINNSSLIKDSDDSERSILMEIGALDKGDKLRNGTFPCVLLTEDADTKYIKVIAESSGFRAEEYETWSYDGCSNIHIALALNSFINKYAPGTSVVVHRDRDYLSNEDLVQYKENLQKVGIKVFITQGNDAESYFINGNHISELYPQINLERANQLIDDSLTERKDAVIEKYINTVHDRKVQQSYKEKGNKPNVGAISQECTRNFEASPRDYMHGKIVEGTLRSKIQTEIGSNTDLCRVTPHIADNTLKVFASEIWSDDT